MTDDTTDRRAGCCPHKAAAHDVTRDAANDRAGGGALVLPCHSGTTAQTDQDCRRNCAD